MESFKRSFKFVFQIPLMNLILVSLGEYEISLATRTGYCRLDIA